ncbi:MAG: hypothetical protein K0U34_01160 [Alphaproteobacteria bacterium]|nr:hypothetical protein [Alphaproteobacteria bacterium]
MSRLPEWLAPVFLITLGCLQMAGDLLELPLLKGFAAATSASPAPKVFTAHKGFETYSSYFYLVWTDATGELHELKLTPQNYAGVRGPYNRRNAYGAALSYAPVLQSSPYTKPMHEAAMHYVFCGDSTILREIGVDRTTVRGPMQFELRPRQKLPADHTWKLSYTVACDEQ